MITSPNPLSFTRPVETPMVVQAPQVTDDCRTIILDGIQLPLYPMPSHDRLDFVAPFQAGTVTGQNMPNAPGLPPGRYVWLSSGGEALAFYSLGAQ